MRHADFIRNTVPGQPPGPPHAPQPGAQSPPARSRLGAPAFINNELKIITEKGNFDVFTLDLVKTAAPIGHLLDVIS